MLSSREVRVDREQFRSCCADGGGAPKWGRIDVHLCLCSEFWCKWNIPRRGGVTTGRARATGKGANYALLIAILRKSFLYHQKRIHLTCNYRRSAICNVYLVLRTSGNY